MFCCLRRSRDPVQEMVGERATPKTIARLRRELRLDEPLISQFTHYTAASCAVTSAIPTSPSGRLFRTSGSGFPKRCSRRSAMLLASVWASRWASERSKPRGWFADSARLPYLGISFPVYWSD